MENIPSDKGGFRAVQDQPTQDTIHTNINRGMIQRFPSVILPAVWRRQVYLGNAERCWYNTHASTIDIRISEPARLASEPYVPS